MMAVLQGTLLLTVGVFFAWLTRYVLQAKQSRTTSTLSVDTPTKTDAEDRRHYEDITPLIDFDWANTEPEKVHKFKSKYHLTMALENLNLSDLIAMDNTYAGRLQLRRDILSKHAGSTVCCNTVAEPAVLELHHWLFSTYLPRRFPSIYQLDSTSTLLHNNVTNSHISVSAQSAHSALQALGENIDTDFLLLLPHPTAVNPDGHPIYHLQAFVTCFPSGFNTASKLGLPLSAIHAPVPHYEDRLARSMDRFFARLERGRVVRRANWTVTTDDRLFAPSGTHLYKDNENKDGRDDTNDIATRAAQVVPENCRLRCERQTLFRLPRTRALVFSFKTYLYNLDTIRDDPDLATAMIEAIDGLEKGNAPEMMHYKSGVVWGEPVKRYLREGLSMSEQKGEGEGNDGVDEKYI